MIKNSKDANILLFHKARKTTNLVDTATALLFTIHVFFLYKHITYKHNQARKGGNIKLIFPASNCTCYLLLVNNDDIPLQ